MSPDDKDDERLQEFLDGDSALSRAYRGGAREEPGAELDARILAHAHRQVGGASVKRRVAHSPFARHWSVPASLAAVLVLSVSVVVLLPDPAGEPGAPTDSTLEAGGTERVTGTTLNAPEAEAPGRTRLPGESQGFADSLREQDSAEEHKPRTLQRSASEAKRQDKKEAGKAAEKREQSTDDRDAAAPGSNAEPAAAPSPAPSATSQEQVQPPSRKGARQEAEEAVAGLPPVEIRNDAQAWLRHIEALVAADQPQAARRNLRAFRSRYPDIALPPRLVPLADPSDATR